MKKVLLLLCLMSTQLVFARGTCINLNAYNLGGSNNSQSEIADYNNRKFKIYREYIVNENKISNAYAKMIEDLYDRAISDSALQAELKKLNSKKQSAIKTNCNHYKNLLSKLR